LLGVDQSQSPSDNVGFEGFFWAWNGQGVVDPGGSASTGFRLGNKNSNSDFSYVGGSDPQFAYFSFSAGAPNTYITKVDLPFDFLGAVFSSTTQGRMRIVGQQETATGQGSRAYVDVQGATTEVEFDGIKVTVPLTTTDFRDIDRLVISSVDTNGTAASFQWTLNDFTYAPVPEPGTWAMFGLGVLGVGFAVKRRKPRIR